MVSSTLDPGVAGSSSSVPGITRFELPMAVSETLTPSLPASSESKENSNPIWPRTFCSSMRQFAAPMMFAATSPAGYSRVARYSAPICGYFSMICRALPGSTFGPK